MTPNIASSPPYPYHHTIMRLPAINQMSPNNNVTQFYNQKISKSNSNETKSQQNSNTNGTSNVKRKRSWSRAVFSNLQRKGLERQFEFQKYITKPDRKKLAARLGLKDAQVKVWFQVTLDLSLNICAEILMKVSPISEPSNEMETHNKGDNDSQQNHRFK